jgi:aspartyl-tRNA synthetase
VAHIARNHLVEEGFVEVETPTLFRYSEVKYVFWFDLFIPCRATPEGAREFIVPTRQKVGMS